MLEARVIQSKNNELAEKDKRVEDLEKVIKIISGNDLCRKDQADELTRLIKDLRATVTPKAQESIETNDKIIDILRKCSAVDPVLTVFGLDKIKNA